MAKTEMPVKILLVDDMPANLLSLEAALESLGLNLMRANSGQEALSHLTHEDFAVVLMDVRMPEMDGFETATTIRTGVTPTAICPSFSLPRRRIMGPIKPGPMPWGQSTIY